MTEWRWKTEYCKVKGTLEPQVSFWLRLLSLSFTPEEPLGYAGKPANAPTILLVGTHADTVKCGKSQHNGQWSNPMAHTLVENMRRHFGAELTILSDIFVVDNNAKNPGSNLSVLKHAILSTGRTLRSREPSASAVLKKIQDRLPLWRASKLLLTWDETAALFQAEINPLITRRDTDVLVRQLVFMGEILEVGRHVVVSPHHLCNQLVMPFLYGQLQLKTGRALFRPRDLHFIFSNYWHDTVEVTRALLVLGVCVEVGVEFEFPALADRVAVHLPSSPTALTILIQLPDFPSYPVLIFARILAHIRAHTQSIRYLQTVQVGFTVESRWRPFFLLDPSL